MKPLAKALHRDYYVDADAVRDAVKTAGSFNAIHFASAIKADFFVAGDDAFEAERLASRQAWKRRAVCCTWTRRSTRMLRKLEWYRRGGEVSDRQWRDVLAIVRIQGDRSTAIVLRQWAPRLGVADLLQRVIG